MYKFVLKVSWTVREKYSDRATTHRRVVSLTAQTEAEAYEKARNIFKEDGRVLTVSLEEASVEEVEQPAIKYTTDMLLDRLETYGGIYNDHNNSNS